jgi:hypothetical protein
MFSKYLFWDNLFDIRYKSTDLALSRKCPLYKPLASLITAKKQLSKQRAQDKTTFGSAKYSAVG